ncbi:MAG: S-layer family protein [Cyanobacteria bacterium SID2]|nr:S-layer family protein [Cyanobacteria bacterium SID2]
MHEIFKDLQSASKRLLFAVVVWSLQISSLNFLSSKPAFSQIVPDRTLSIPSQVAAEENTYTIEGGTAAGNNLFHSFESFSVPTGTEAFFNNATTVENILTRVTGNNISNIDGRIRANGIANLFLLNPNGLIFGPNAQLDVGGSFFATTANSIVFDNGLEFSATTPEAQPLLLVSVPTGLQFNGQGGEIRVRGEGHSFTAFDPLFSPIFRNNDARGLQVNPGRTLAFVGGDITLDGAMLTAEGGRIELGGVEEGFVRSISPVSPESQQWRFNYDGVSSFRDVHLVRQAAVDVSGVSVGSMQLVGRQVALSDGSMALLQNQGTQTFGLLRVQASESLTLTGMNPDGSIATSLRQATIGLGSAGDMDIATRRLAIREGAQIVNRTQDMGNAGDIDIRASESIELTGASPRNPIARNLIANASFGMGLTGDLIVSTHDLSVRGGGNLATVTFGAGSAGNIFVTATEVVEVIGVEPRILAPSILGSASFSMGNAGSGIVNTSRVIVRDGGRLAAVTFASGNGGRLVVNASEFVEISGTVPGSINASSIDASANRVEEVTQQIFRVSSVPSGSPGDLEINTPQLNITEGGLVTVRNSGTGRAGRLQVNAEAVLLDDRGGITASTQSGEGGNVTLRVDDSLQLRHASQITAEAGGIGNGGNLAISADTIVLLEGSTIDANAFQGQGGNIQIETQGLLLSPDSRISASSQLGVDGLVTIAQPEIETRSALVQLSSDPLDATTQIVSACSVAEENTFIVTGNGGLPPDPTDVLRGQDVWVDTRLPDFVEASPLRQVDSHEEEGSSIELPLVEATGWQHREDGTVELVATPQVRVGNRWRGNCRD